MTEYLVKFTAIFGGALPQKCQNWCNRYIITNFNSNITSTVCCPACVKGSYSHTPTCDNNNLCQIGCGRVRGFNGTIRTHCCIECFKNPDNHGQTCRIDNMQNKPQVTSTTSGVPSSSTTTGAPSSSTTTGVPSSSTTTGLPQAAIKVTAHNQTGKSVRFDANFTVDKSAHNSVAIFNNSTDGQLPSFWSVFMVGPAYIGGLGNRAIMRDIVNLPNYTVTKPHVTVYYKASGGPVTSLELAQFQ